MWQRIFLGGLIPVDNVTMKEVLSFVQSCLKDNLSVGPRIIIAQNATKAALHYCDPQFGQQLTQADLLIPDGTALLLSARLLGCPAMARVTGIDVMEQMLQIANLQRKKVFFLGAEEKVRQKLIESVKSRFHNLIIAGSMNGFFIDRQAEIIKAIDGTKPDMLFVALGSPKQENWLFANRNQISAKICIGVGGSFDIIAGLKKRAPYLCRNSGLEAIYRICKEPSRIFRLSPYVILTYFTLKSCLGKNRVCTEQQQLS